MFARSISILRRTVTNWSDDGASNWAAALAFYTMLSVGPLLFVAVAIAGLVFGQDVASGAILEQMSNLMGDEAAQAVGRMMQEAATPKRGLLATAMGIATLLFGATGVFAALQDAINGLWHVRPKPDAGVVVWIKKRFLSMSMVLGLGFLLMVSLVLNGLMAALWQQTAGMPTSQLLRVGEFVSSWALGGMLMAGIFKVLPDAHIPWRSALVGAATTTVLLNIGKAAIGLYLGRSGIGDAFGAAGSLALVLLWVYYAAQVLFLGAAFTRVFSQDVGAQIRPDPDAVAVETVPVREKHKPAKAARAPGKPAHKDRQSHEKTVH
ncbi:hypothetical protein Q3G72_028373 [Acer saccharum]|nr:hypothetical protein Q3G72_028373 [Acer saccharum]